VTTFPRDLPVLWVRAGLDSPRMNSAIDRLAALALSQNAPITVINHRTGHHAFEARDDDVATPQVIDQSLEFVKRATAPEYQAVIRRE
jgi:dienelactone hydrolase